MNINEAKDYIFAIARKNQIGNIPIQQLNLYFRRAQLEIVSSLRDQYELTSIVSDNLAPLVTPVELYNSSDKFIKPDDYYHWVDIYSNLYTNSESCGVDPTKEWVPVELIPQNKKSYRRSSLIVSADNRHPIAINYGSYFEVVPTPVKVQLTYIRQPKNPVWAYVDTPQRPVYNPLLSQDFELPESTHQEICFKVLNYMGIATRDADLYQVTNEQPSN